jgi:hypothetical protein
MNVDVFVLKSEGVFVDMVNGVYGVIPTDSDEKDSTTNEEPTESNEVRTFDKPTNLEGYVIQDKKETYFLTTKVEID